VHFCLAAAGYVFWGKVVLRKTKHERKVFSGAADCASTWQWASGTTGGNNSLTFVFVSEVEVVRKSTFLKNVLCAAEN
jgi:hypothetical protein